MHAQYDPTQKKKKLWEVSVTPPALAVPASDQKDKPRKWTSSTGTTIEATLTEYDPEQQTVTLEREDGKKHSLRLQQLSEADVKWIKSTQGAGKSAKK